MTVSQNGYTPLDLYALSRWFRGLEITVTPHNPFVAAWVSNMRVGERAHWETAMKLFQAHSPAIFAIDPEGKPPQEPEQYAGEAYVPPLPPQCAPSTVQKEEALKTGRWLSDGMKWIHKRAQMTPKLFLESGLLSAVGIAIARRAVLRLDHDVYPNGYDLWVAPTSYFRKSTGLRAIIQLVRQTLPHMLLASQATPELIQNKLSGKKATNYNDLPLYQRKLEDEGVKYAAQRAIIVDEATKTLFSSKKYMEGLAELLMEMFDPSDLIERELKNEGKLLIYYPSVTVLGATTPARLARSITDMEWEDGVLARFALLTPTETEVKRSRSSPLDDDYDPPAGLKARLAAIHNALPAPLEGDLFSENAPPELPAVNCTMAAPALDSYNAYADFMHECTNPSHSGIDPKLIGNYSRLPTLALKTAIRLAVMDWSDDGAKGVPHISLAHWHHALLIAEQYRESAHRLLVQISRSADIENEEKVLEYVGKFNDRLPTEREIHTGTRIRNRKDVKEAISALVDAGEIVPVERKSARGPNTIGYKLPDGI